MPATEPAPEVASCSLRNNRRPSRQSSPRITGSSERRMEVSPGAKKHSPRPWIPSSVSRRTKVQSKLPSTTAVFRRTIFNLPLNSAAQVGNSSRQIACNPKANRLEGVVTLAIEMAIPPPHSVLHHLQGIVLASLLALGSSARKDERKKACRTRLSVGFRYAASAVTASSSWSMERICSGQHSRGIRKGHRVDRQSKSVFRAEPPCSTYPHI